MGANDPSPPAISDPSEVRRVVLIARDTEYHTLNQTDRELLERTNGRIWERIQAEPETYILSPDEFAVFNFYQNVWPHRPIAENAVKRYWDSQQKVNGH